MVEKKQAEAGQGFQVQADVSMTLEQLRSDALKEYGREIHIKAKFGPIEVRDDGLSGKFEAVDDPFLDGNFQLNTLIRLSVDGSISFVPNTVVYMGHFK